MATKRRTTIAVDNSFFEKIFEQKRMSLQKELGLNNLSQTNFSKMIIGLKIKKLKINPIVLQKKRGKKKNEFII